MLSYVYIVFNFTYFRIGIRKDGSNKMSLREDQVGITEYVSNGAGFTGVVKSRFSDFHVNEIDLDGKVLQLNDLTVPKPAEHGKLNFFHI